MSGDARRIGDLLDRWIGDGEGKSADLTTAATRWCADQGIVLHRARYQEGSLQLYVTSAAAATELRFRSEELRLALAEDPARPPPDLKIKIHPL